MSSLGERVRARRKELRLTLRELAARCELSASYLCDLELGKRGCGADVLVSLSAVLGLPMDQLMKGGERQTAGAQVQLPASLMQFALEADLRFRQTQALYWMMKTVMDHRTNDKRISLEQVDWLRFYEAIKEFL